MTAVALILPLAGVALAALAPFERTFSLVLLSARMELEASGGLVLAVVALLWVAAAFRQARTAGRTDATGSPSRWSRRAAWGPRRRRCGHLLHLLLADDAGVLRPGRRRPRARWAAALYLGAAWLAR